MNEIEFNGVKICYKIYRSRIKNMYIHIKEGQVIVKASLRLNEKYIIDFVNKKAKWIYSNVNKYEDKPKVQERFEEKDIERLKMVINNSVELYSKVLGVSPIKVRIRDIKYAWGSCSSKKNITINLKLAAKRDELIQYVVLHEMCHLIEMNHSRKFWSLIEQNMPEYKNLRKELKS